MKMSDRSRRLLIACLLVMLLFIAVGAVLTLTGEGDPNAGAEDAVVSVEPPVEQEPQDPTPALIGGGAAIVVYFVASTVIDTVKLRRKRKQKNDGKQSP